MYLSHLSPQQLAWLTTQFGDTYLVRTSTNILGVQVRGNVSTGNVFSRFEARIPCLGGPPEQEGALPTGLGDISPSAEYLLTQREVPEYSVVFRGATPQAAYDAYVGFLNGQRTPDIATSLITNGADFKTGIYRCSVSSAGVNPLVGNAESLQSAMVSNGLDFSTATMEPEDNWGVGGRIGRVNRDGVVGTQFEARVNRSIRLGEGSRSRIIVDVPVSYLDAPGASYWRAFAAVALDHQVTPRWSLQPRIGYGFVSAPDQHLKGQMLSTSITSLWRIDGLGRGGLTIGNMLGYTKATNIRFSGTDIGNGTANIVLRNGLAYELPLGQRFAGRSSSARASYTYTRFYGDELFMNDIHEMSASLGVRSRGTDSRNSFELWRIGLIGKLGEQYKSIHAFVGYRF